MAMPCRNRAEGKGNTAEVEFVLQIDNEIVPVEVKSENNVKAKSLSIYRKTYSPSLSLRFSTRNIRKDDDLLNLPLYLADRISEILVQYRNETLRYEK